MFVKVIVVILLWAIGLGLWHRADEMFWDSDSLFNVLGVIALAIIYFAIVWSLAIIYHIWLYLK